MPTVGAALKTIPTPWHVAGLVQTLLSWQSLRQTSLLHTRPGTQLSLVTQLPPSVVLPGVTHTGLPFESPT